MPRLRINDGYTLPGQTKVRPEGYPSTAPDLPVVDFSYRPALPDAIAEWRYTYTRATSGREQVTATAKLVVDHLVAWDVEDDKGIAVIHVDMVRLIPEPILTQLSDIIQTWAPKADAEAGKSPPVSG